MSPMEPTSADDHRQQALDETAAQVTEKVLDKPGVHAPEAEVRRRAEVAVDGLLDQPVQTFTPLLAENEVLTGLHRDELTEPGGWSQGDSNP